MSTGSAAAPPPGDLWIDQGARHAARFIPEGARVLDFGGQGASLAPHLPVGCALVPAEEPYDVVVALAPFSDPDLALQSLQRLCALGKPVVLGLRPPGATAGHLCRETLVQLIGKAGFARARIEEVAGGTVARLEPAAPPYRPEREVWVLSYSNVGNFGDRLGQHLLSQVLPPNARLVRLQHEPWNAPPDGRPDLLILGIGNSLFQPLLNERLFELLGRAKTSIGIFGTQYREAIERPRLAAVIDRLDVWWARNEADLHLYGKDRSNVRHLGDWMIDAFPLTRPTRSDLLVVGDEIWEDRPLDRTIERIQAHSQVMSSRLHPLLCALTSARMVGYREQREVPMATASSGKFRSMLLDIFGYDQPEAEFWAVDRNAVVDYKAKVRGNIARLREDLARLLA